MNTKLACWKETEGDTERCYSVWRSVTRGGLQRSVLGPIFFAIYINDLYDNVVNMVSKILDGTKIG